MSFRSRRFPGEGDGHPPQYSCLGNPIDRGAWRAAVHGVAEADMTERLSAQITESLCCTAVINTTLYINYAIKKRL